MYIALKILPYRNFKLCIALKIWHRTQFASVRFFFCFNVRFSGTDKNSIYNLFNIVWRADGDDTVCKSNVIKNSWNDGKIYVFCFVPFAMAFIMISLPIYRSKELSENFFDLQNKSHYSNRIFLRLLLQCDDSEKHTQIKLKEPRRNKANYTFNYHSTSLYGSCTRFLPPC